MCEQWQREADLLFRWMKACCLSSEVKQYFPACLKVQNVFSTMNLEYQKGGHSLITLDKVFFVNVLQKVCVCVCESVNQICFSVGHLFLDFLII